MGEENSKLSGHDIWIGPLAKAISEGLYSFTVEGREHLQISGGFIVACNHVSFLDWLFLMAGLKPRPLRFLIDETFTNMPVVGAFVRTSKAIPICVNSVKPRAMLKSMDRVVEALKAGEAVGLFPEGALTRDGEVQKFRSGIEILVERAQVPVVPAALTGIWGSIWSWKGGRLLWKKPLRLKTKVSLKFGPPLYPEELSSDLLRIRIKALLG